MTTRTPQITLCAAAALLAAGCGSVTPTREVSSTYAVYDVKAAPDVPAARIVEAIKVALQHNTNRVQLNGGLPPSPLPDKPPRFQLASPFAGTGLAALAAASGQALEVPACSGAILTATARDTGMAGFGQDTTFFTCLMPYQGGYSLNVHTTFARTSGALGPGVMAATLLRPLVGDNSQFIPRTLQAIVDGVRQTGASVALLESYP